MTFYCLAACCWVGSPWPSVTKSENADLLGCEHLLVGLWVLRWTPQKSNQHEDPLPVLASLPRALPDTSHGNSHLLNSDIVAKLFCGILKKMRGWNRPSDFPASSKNSSHMAMKSKNHTSPAMPGLVFQHQLTKKIFHTALKGDELCMSLTALH